MSEWFGYLAGVFSNGLLLALLVILWRGRFQGVWLIQAVLITAIWSGYFYFSSLQDFNSPMNTGFVEIIHSTAWVLFLWKLHSAQHGVSSYSFWKTPALWGFLFGVLALLVLNVIQGFAGYPFERISLELIAPFGLGVFSLILLEQWYRNIKRENRWRVKFLALGLLVIFVYDFVLFSEALLYDRVDPTLWVARGWIDALMVPLMAVSIARTDNMGQPIRVSHQAAFYTTGILLAGAYLLGMAAVGYYLRWFGGSWGGALQIVFVVFSLALLVLLLASGSARGSLSVWLSKHFFAYKYDYREQWIKANSHFAELAFDGDYFEELIKAIAAPVDSMGGWIWVNQDNHLVLKANWSVNEPVIVDKRENLSELVDFVVATGWIIELDEFKENPERYEGISLPASMLEGDDLWILIPLLHHSKLHGLIGLRKPRSKRSINWEDYDLLKALGGQIASMVAFKNASDALTEARQFEAFNRLSAFVVHDLKNIIAQLSLVVTNAEKHKRNPEFIDDALDTLDNAVNRMNRLLSQLRQQSQLNVHATVEEAAEVVLEVVRHQKDGLPKPEFVGVDTPAKIHIEKDRFVSVLCHLVQNAQDATPDAGSITLDYEINGNHVVFRIRDTGEGMDADFIRDRLFKPFDTTKGSAGMGVGVYEAQQFVQQAGGTINVESELGQGTMFEVFIPLHSS